MWYPGSGVVLDCIVSVFITLINVTPEVIFKSTKLRLAMFTFLIENVLHYNINLEAICFSSQGQLNSQ